MGRSDDGTGDGLKAKVASIDLKGRLKLDSKAKPAVRQTQLQAWMTCFSKLKQLQEVDFSSQGLQEADVKLISDGIGRATSVTSLNLSYNDLGPTSAKHIASLLKVRSIIITEITVCIILLHVL